MASIQKTSLAIALGLSSSLTALHAYSQDTSLALEEVVVTATKRAAGLQDVPIAISVVSGDKIEAQGIGELEDMSVFLPNVHIAEAGAGTQLFIRGIGSGVNPGFEQSVGTFIDGVYYGRGRSARAGFLDLERVEVLKGPQSTLFGKNTIAGAINITSAKPSDEFEAYIEGTYETEVEGVGVTAMLSGPLTDTLGGRLVAKKYEDDGYIENNFTGPDGPQEDNTIVRGTLVWDATDNLLFTLKAEHGEFDITGRQAQISIASPTATLFYQAFGDPNFQAGFDYEKSQADFPGRPSFDDTESDIVQLTAEYQLGEHTLRSITGYTEYEYEYTSDVDVSSLAFLERSREESHEQFSQELLLTSPVGGTIEYLTGIYYQTNELAVGTTRTTVAVSALPPVEAAINGRLAAAGIPGAPFPTGAMDALTIGLFDQDTDTWSAFVSLTWNVNDVFRVQAGLRYSDEEKEMTKSLVVADLDSNPDPFLAGLYDQVLMLATEHEFDLNRSQDNWTGNLNFQYDITGEIMLYLNLANGFKAGGYDQDNARADATTEEFEEETVESIEIGTKMELWDGRARLNMALFKSDFEDVQVSTFDGNCCFVVGNAAETEVEGFEADFVLAVTEGLTLTGALAYLDATYGSFPGAACNVFQVTELIAAGGLRGDCEQDLSGKPLQFAPEWSANLGAEYITPLFSDAVELTLGLEFMWSDDVVIPNDLDPNLIQEDFWKLNARAAIGAADGTWSLAVVGKNLSDEETTTWGNDVPLGSFGFDFTYFQFIDPPRTVEVQARYSFF
ncbi:MAG: TonB-dependent receptor [Pseudomonadales bacterium]